MGLVPGSRLGPYEVVAQIGVGGMGEVYRARDTNLDRHVAIKTLPEAFARDHDRLARFEREAKTLASLNHPNIAIIHGLEEADDGIRALVMELVEGPTLADRVAQAALPGDQALPIAKQIAEALEAAHEQGIIHRDLKPANVKVREDGVVKVLDFGLAKAFAHNNDAVSSPSVTNSPTLASPGITGVGVLLGTAAYMAPEQAKGKSLTKAADIWAFGCVLYPRFNDSCATASTKIHGAAGRMLPVSASSSTTCCRQRAVTRPQVWRRVRCRGDRWQHSPV
jgi:serine/threonine protein kinase